MSFSSLPRALAGSHSARGNRAEKGPRRVLRTRQLRCEPLEDRRLLSINYPTFADSIPTTELIRLGSTEITDNVLRLAPSTGGVGAAWFTDPQVVSVHFETTFQFQLSDGSGGPGGSDGFAFVIQNNGPYSASELGGCYLGYTLMPNSLAVEFDTYLNELDPFGNELGDPSHSHIGVHTGGAGDNAALESYALGSANTSGFLLDDGSVHTAKIQYTPGDLNVYVDDLVNPVLTVPIDLADTLDLDIGRAWVGFTGATGGDPTNHDILNWHFSSLADDGPVIIVNDINQLEGAEGDSTNFQFTVSRFGDSSGTVTVDWSTVNGTAIAGSDFQSGSGHVMLPPGEAQQTFEVTVLGDDEAEGPEEFFVELSNAFGAEIADGIGRGVIDFDDTESFTIVLMPDTQNYSTGYPHIFNTQSQWIIDNKDTENFVFVSHLGDVVNDPNTQLEWERGDAAMATLDGDLVSNPDGLIPYSVAAGNHDFGGADVNGYYVQYFGASRYSGRSWYGGASPDETSHYQLFQAGGREFLHITVEYDPGDAAIQWAQSVIDSHPDLPAILTTHGYIHEDGLRPEGERVFHELVEPNPQFFMILCGHFWWENHLSSYNSAGTEVFEILADYQGRPQGGDGWLQFLEFFPELNRIDVWTYSPVLDRYETDNDSLFSLDIDFDRRFDFSDTLGDVNGDGQVNGLDVDPFVDVLLDSSYDVAADMNQDGVVNGLDVDPFVAAVVGGGDASGVAPFSSSDNDLAADIGQPGVTSGATSVPPTVERVSDLAPESHRHVRDLHEGDHPRLIHHRAVDRVFGRRSRLGRDRHRVPADEVIQHKHQQQTVMGDWQATVERALGDWANWIA